MENKQPKDQDPQVDHHSACGPDLNKIMNNVNTESAENPQPANNSAIVDPLLDALHTLRLEAILRAATDEQLRDWDQALEQALRGLEYSEDEDRIMNIEYVQDDLLQEQERRTNN